MLKNIQLAELLTETLSKQRSANHAKWKQVGKVLYSVSPDGLFNSFINFTKLGGKKSEKSCTQLWKKLNSCDNNGTIRQLHIWAEEDNPMRYKKVMFECARVLNHNHFSTIIDVYAQKISIQDIANIAKYYLGHRFICVSTKYSTWYVFDYHKWKKRDTYYMLQHFVMKKVCNILCDYVAYFCSVRSEHDTKYTIQRRLAKVAVMNGIIKKIKSKKSFAKKILSLCKKEMYNGQFFSQLDANKFLLGFDNGVYDLDRGIFRRGYPDDYVSLSVGYDYKTYANNSREVRWIENFFSITQPDAELNFYTKLLFANSLIGKITQCRKMTIIVKHTELFDDLIDHHLPLDIIVLLIKSLGSYACSLPLSLIKKNSKDREKVALLRGVRCSVINAMDRCDVEMIDFEKMYNLITCDITHACADKKKGLDKFTLKPQHKLFLICSVLPHIPDADNKIWPHIDVSKTKNTFLKNKAQTTELHEILGLYRQPFMWLLLNTYIPMCKRRNYNIKLPSSLGLVMEQYQDRCNIFSKFIKKYLLITGNNIHLEKLDNVYNSFKLWFSNSHFGDKYPSLSEFKKYLKDNYKNTCKFKGNNIIGVKFI